VIDSSGIVLSGPLQSCLLEGKKNDVLRGGAGGVVDTFVW
jgi:hypothetical protein